MKYFCFGLANRNVFFDEGLWKRLLTILEIIVNKNFKASIRRAVEVIAAVRNESPTSQSALADTVYLSRI